MKKMKIWMIQKKLPKIRFVLAAVFIILTACATNSLIPVASDGIAIEDGYAVLRTDSLLIAIRPQVMTGSQSNYRPKFFSVYFRITNTSKHAIVLNSKHIKAVSDGIQYDTIALQHILNNVHKDMLVSQYDDDFSQETTTDMRGNQQQAVSDVINGYYSFGDILPGTTKVGYVFFHPNLQRADRLQLYLYGSMIYFAKPKANK